VRRLTEMGAEVKAHDPYVQHWWELEKQDTYPAVGTGWSRFFRNQEHLKGFKMIPDLGEALEGGGCGDFCGSPQALFKSGTEGSGPNDRGPCGGDRLFRDSG